MAHAHGKTIGKLALIVVGMFGFGFALVPLYGLICDITGLGGRTGGPYTFDPASLEPDLSRTVELNFLTNTNGGMPWKFWSEKGGMRVHPGEINEAYFYVRNPTDRPMVGQAIMSVVPIRAADHFHKTECFCFRQQVLKPGEKRKMPMRFIVGRELPQNVESISISYSLFDITKLAAHLIEDAPESSGD